MDKKCKAVRSGDPPLQLKWSGLARKTSKKKYKVIKQQVDAGPRSTAKELKKKTPNSYNRCLSPQEQTRR